MFTMITSTKIENYNTKRFEIVGVEDADKIRKDLWNTVNSREKVNKWVLYNIRAANGMMPFAALIGFIICGLPHRSLFVVFSHNPQTTELKSIFHGIKIHKLRNLNPQFTEKPYFRFGIFMLYVYICSTLSISYRYVTVRI